MHEVERLKDMLCCELEEYGHKEQMDVGDLEIVDKLAHAIKNIDKILMAKEYGLSYDDGMSMRDDRSYRMDGGRDQRYSRDNRGYSGRRDSRGRYSRERGYSEAEHKELVEELRDIMDGADQTMKKEFEHFIKKIEQM